MSELYTDSLNRLAQHPIGAIIEYNGHEFIVALEEKDKLDACTGCHFLNRTGVCRMTEAEREFFGCCSAARSDGKGVRFIQVA